MWTLCCLFNTDMDTDTEDTDNIQKINDVDRSIMVSRKKPI